MTRLEANLKIVYYLEEFFKQNPDMRFQQALYGLNIITNEDKFYEESVDTYERLLDTSESLETLP